MTVAHITLPEAEVAALCRRNGIRKLALFGSMLTDRFSDHSDIDVLVEFRPHERVGFFQPGRQRLDPKIGPVLPGRMGGVRNISVSPRNGICRADARYHSRQA
jgi:hypothetical protein